ncbi:MAG: hypothetical protein QOI15_2977, partial [Pseudonocardiales bacterium]|nr:hypothetical protein [Pseudonocardiales bacterium]
MTDPRSRRSRRTRRAVALFGGVGLAVLAWPGPSSADTSLGGYSGVAQAEAIRIQIFDPVIPIPTDPGKPQVDAGIAYSKSIVDTGPVTRATASYLWPGDVLGDGFGQLVGNDAAQYAIQVNSRYPETAAAPANNTAQLTDGNGMTTSTDGFHTKATTTGLGVVGPDTDLLSGIGEGLKNLPLGGHKTPTPNQPSPELPLPIGQMLAGLATVKNVSTTSTVDVEDKSVTVTAHAQMSEISLLHGLITIDGIKVTSTVASDGKKATTSGTIRPVGITVAGLDIGLDGKGVAIGGGDSTAPPEIPSTVTDLLRRLGIEFTYAPTTQSIDGATGTLASDALVISIDTQPLKTALNVGGLIGPLQDLVGRIPKLGSQLGPLLGLGPKIVFRIGDVFTSATAAPAYVGPVIPPSGGGGNPGGGNPGGNTGGGTVPGTGGGVIPPAGGGPVTNPPVTGPPISQPSQPTAFALPGLGDIPKMMILAGLALALAAGWLFRTLGGFLFG